MPGAPAASTQNGWLAGIGLLLLTLLLYIPTYQAGFIWDDDVIAANPLLREGWPGLRDIWLSTRFGDFVPLTATTFWVEWQVHGSMKEIQHATNVVLHALNALLLWRVLLFLRIPGAWLVAALFAVHPVSVASVTWLAERKNTLSMFFYLLSLLLYLRSENGEGSRKAYGFSIFFFLCGLLSKSSVVVLPVVLLLCAWWERGKIDRRTLARVVPFFGLALVAGIATLVAHHYIAPRFGVHSSGDTLLVRTLTAGRAFWFYLVKDVWPIGLTMHYPRWNLDAGSPLAYLPSLGIIGLFALSWHFRRTWGRACLFGIGYFVIALGPTIGVINMAYLVMAPVADHFQYLALPGILALAVAGTFHLAERCNLNRKHIPALMSLVGASLALLSWQHQTKVGNPEMLWRDNIARNPSSWAAHNNLAGVLFERGDYPKALEHYEKALERRSDLSMVHVNVGRALFAQGKAEAAIEHYANALEADEKDFKAFNNMGVALINLGRTNDAWGAFARAVQLAPAESSFFVNLVLLLRDTGQSAKAMEVCRDRLGLFPGDTAAHYQLGQLYFEQEDLESALTHYKAAVQVSPGFVDARFGLAEIEAQLNNKSAAIKQWREILRLQPDAVPVIANLAWALATDYNSKLRNGAEAVQLAERACLLAGRENPRFLDLLAAAYAEAGRFPDATKTIQDGIARAEAMNDRSLIYPMRQRLGLYQSGKAYRSN